MRSGLFTILQCGDDIILIVTEVAILIGHSRWYGRNIELSAVHLDFDGRRYWAFHVLALLGESEALQFAKLLALTFGDEIDGMFLADTIYLVSYVQCQLLDSLC